MEPEKKESVMDEANSLLEIESRIEPHLETFKKSGLKEFNDFLHKKVWELTLEALAISYEMNTITELKSVLLKQYMAAYEELKKLE
jgi:hypothetical protein